jgi:hypothetical protein
VKNKRLKENESLAGFIGGFSGVFFTFPPRNQLNFPPSLSLSLPLPPTATGKLQYVLSRWGGKLLVVDDFTFTSNKRQNDVEYWRCTFCSARKKEPCKARCRTQSGRVFGNSVPHNHPPQQLRKQKIP